MPKYVIEREIPNAGKLSKDELQAISQKSCGVLRNLGPQIQWLQSYVTGDKLYCVYIAPNEKMVRACRARRLPGESHLGSKIHHRSDNGGALDERDAWPGTTDRPDAALQNPKAYARWSTSWVPNDRAR